MIAKGCSSKYDNDYMLMILLNSDSDNRLQYSRGFGHFRQSSTLWSYPSHCSLQSVSEPPQEQVLPNACSHR